MSRYQAMEQDNGAWCVVDFHGIGFQMVAAGMTKQAAQEWADRLNLRNAWGT